MSLILLLRGEPAFIQKWPSALLKRDITSNAYIRNITIFLCYSNWPKWWPSITPWFWTQQQEVWLSEFALKLNNTSKTFSCTLAIFHNLCWTQTHLEVVLDTFKSLWFRPKTRCTKAALRDSSVTLWQGERCRKRLVPPSIQQKGN